MTNKKKTILIVDDEKDISNTLKDIFNSKGYEVEVAYDGVMAIELVKKKIFDIVLIDIIMDKMDGLETLEKIQELKLGISLFVMTAHYSKISQALERGALRVFRKPFDIEEVARIFDEEISKKVK